MKRIRFSAPLESPPPPGTALTSTRMRRKVCATGRIVWLVCLVQRPGRQRLAAPGDHDAAPWSGRRGAYGHYVRVGGQTSPTPCGGPRPHTESTRSESVMPTRTGRIGTRSTWCASARARSCRHEQRLRRDRARRGLAGRALRGSAGRGRPARCSRGARVGGRRVLVLRVHPVQDAAPARRGGARGAGGGRNRRGRHRGRARLARLHGLRLLRRRAGATGWPTTEST